MNVTAFRRIRNDVRELCSAGTDRSSRNPRTLERAAAWIEAEFRATGGKVVSQPVHYRCREYRNIILRLGNTSGKRIVIGAHYDTVTGTVGADDNASAVALLLETARGLAQEKLSACIELVAWTLEEPPAFASPTMGSAHHAASLREAGVTPALVLCFEMVGYYPKGGWKPYAREVLAQYLAPEGGHPSETERLLSMLPDSSRFTVLAGGDGHHEVRSLASMFSRDTRFPCVPLAFPGEHLLLNLSDQMNYRGFGCPCLMLTDTAVLRNPHYHTSGDIPGTLDYELLAMLAENVTRGLLQWLEVGSHMTPGRLLDGSAAVAWDFASCGSVDDPDGFYLLSIGKRNYVVLFERRSLPDSVSERLGAAGLPEGYEFAFKDKDEDELPPERLKRTGFWHPAVLFSTLSVIMRSVLEKGKPELFFFTSYLNDPTRTRLYERFAGRIAEAYPYRWTCMAEGAKVYFVFSQTGGGTHLSERMTGEEESRVAVLPGHENA